MKCHILFSMENIINLSSAELAQSAVKLNTQLEVYLFILDTIK